MRTGEVNTERSNANLDASTERDIPPDLLQDIRKIPTPFQSYQTAW
jgi:hypothetical protein